MEKLMDGSMVGNEGEKRSGRSESEEKDDEEFSDG